MKSWGYAALFLSRKYEVKVSEMCAVPAIHYERKNRVSVFEWEVKVRGKPHCPSHRGGGGAVIPLITCYPGSVFMFSCSPLSYGLVCREECSPFSNSHIIISISKIFAKLSCENCSHMSLNLNGLLKA